MKQLFPHYIVAMEFVIQMKIVNHVLQIVASVLQKMARMMKTTRGMTMMKMANYITVETENGMKTAMVQAMNM